MNKDSEAFFYRDGYTDIIGSFGYAQSSSYQDISKIEKFAILVLREANNATILEADPPSTQSYFSDYLE